MPPPFSAVDAFFPHPSPAQIPPAVNHPHLKLKGDFPPYSPSFLLFFLVFFSSGETKLTTTPLSDKEGHTYFSLFRPREAESHVEEVLLEPTPFFRLNFPPLPSL